MNKRDFLYNSDNKINILCKESDNVISLFTDAVNKLESCISSMNVEYNNIEDYKSKLSEKQNNLKENMDKKSKILENMKKLIGGDIGE